MKDNNPERNYKVFISYRHLPLDMKVAEKVQTVIEHYIIPKDYRKDGQKKLGIVFRDKNELPITNDLSNNLRIALDHSEYLLVICSRETKKSLWVLEEINYFLKHHDRDHVMVFLVDGTMEESVPEQLMGITDENGNIIEKMEPLAANIATEHRWESKRIFKVEVLRILATLIGCPFDALYHRNQRYMRHRMILVSALVSAVALGFIGMLWNRNNMIQKQYEQSQLHESELRVSLAELEEKDGNYTQAVQYALDALPDNDDRPYIPEAELELSNLMYLYSDQTFQYQYSLGMDDSVYDWDVSPDGKYIVEHSISNTYSVYSGSTRQLMYANEAEQGMIFDIKISADSQKLIITELDKTVALSLKDGKKCWEKPFLSEDSNVVLSGQENFFLSKDPDSYLRLYRVEDGSLYKECSLKDQKDSILYDNFYLSPDQSLLCFITEDNSNHNVQLWDLKHNKIYKIGNFDVDQFNYLTCTFTEDHRLFLTGENTDHTILIDCYQLKNNKINKTMTKSIENLNLSIVQEEGGYEDIQTFQCNKDMIVIANRNALILLKIKDLSIINSTVFTDNILDAQLLDNDQVAVVTKEGEINLFSKSGLSSAQEVNYFNTKYELRDAEILGSSLKDLIIMAQSEEYREQITCIQWKENDRAVWADTVEEKTEKMTYLSSPDEKYTCLIRDAWDQDSVFTGTLWKSGKLVKRFLISKSTWEKIDNDYFIGDFQQCFLTNEGNLIVDGGFIVNLRDNSASCLMNGKKEYYYRYSYVDHNHDGIVTTLQTEQDDSSKIGIWEDGVFQKEIDTIKDASLLNVIGSTKDGKLYMEWMSDSEDESESSYAIYVYDPETRTMKQTLPYSKEDYCDSVCWKLAENNPYCAFMSSSGNIKIIDVSNGKTISNITGNYGKNINSILFIDDDKYLMLFSDNGVIDIIDATSGDSLYHSSSNILGKEWSSNMHFEVSSDEEHDRIIIIADESGLTESICFVFKLSTLDMVGSYTGPVHFNQKNHTLIVNPRSKRLLEIPFYHMEDIIKLAKNSLDE